MTSDPTPDELLELEKKTFEKRAQLSFDHRSTPQRLILRQPARLRWFRFLISDGTFVDVRAVRDDSHLRGQIMNVLTKTRGDVTICGGTEIPLEFGEEPKS